MSNKNDLKLCDVCKKAKRTVSREPSRSQLLFGGFNLRFENRCPACERKVVAWVDKQLEKD
jgi:hypothetical protein